MKSSRGPLVSQPSAAPTRKVTASSLAALAGSFLVDLVEVHWTTAPDTFEPFAIALLVFVAGYYTRERDSPDAEGT